MQKKKNDCWKKITKRTFNAKKCWQSASL